MIRDLGWVQPGTTLYIPFHTFDSNDPSASVTLTGLATTDIEIFKDGGTTQRASDAGYALLDTDGIDFDGITGIHGISIDLADNTTAGFYAAGSQYWVVIASVTVDAATVNFVLCTFRIGQPGAVLNTTIATLSSQTSFTLTAGPADDDALNGCVVRIHDVASAVQAGFAVVQDYTGSTKTVTLVAGTTFTAAATDNVSFFPPALVPTTLGRTLDVSAGGEAGVDWANVGSPTTAVNLSATNIDTDQVVASVTGAVGSVTGAVGSVTGNVGGNVTGSVGSVATGGIAAASFAAGAIDAAAIANGAIDAATFAADVDAEILSYLVDDATRIDASALNTATGTTIPAILTDTAEIGAAGAGLTEAGGTGDHLTAVPWNAAWDAEVQSEVQDAIVANNLDHLLVAAVDTNFATTVHLDSVIGHLADAGGTATFDRTTDALEVLGAATAPSAASIADAVWDEALAGHLAAGSTGEALNAAGSAGDPWVTSLPGAYGAGSAGYIVGTYLDAAISSRGTSTLTQTQVTGGAYALNSASFAFNAALDFTTTQKAATLARVTLVDTTTTNTDMRGTDNAALAATALTSATWTNTRAGYLDNLSAGAVPTLAQILAGGDVDGYTLEQTLKLCLAALAGKLSGAATTTVTIRAADDSKARITATVDSDGNRSAITYDAAG